MEILQDTKSNKQFFLGMECKFNDTRSLNKWTSDLTDEEFAKEERGEQTMKQARENVEELHDCDHIYRLQILFNIET